MLSRLAWLIAIVSTIAFLFLWFRDVRRVLGSQKSTVESAAGQLSACRKRVAEAGHDPALAKVLARSESIDRQAVEHYNRTLCRPWFYLPGRLMGFHREPG